jgi:hypothetical protein
MNNREKLQHLIDNLSESDVDEALQYITWQQENGFASLLHAPRHERSASAPTELDDPSPSGQVIFLDEIKRDGDGYGENAAS